MKVSVVLLLFGISYQVDAWKFCQKGRLYGGNIGEPGGKKAFSASPFVKTLWFKQLLDHFNPRNEDTWLQVENISISFFHISKSMTKINETQMSEKL